MAIHAFLIFNNKGAARLVNVYHALPAQQQSALVSAIQARVFQRPALNARAAPSEAECNFLPANELKAMMKNGWKEGQRQEQSSLEVQQGAKEDGDEVGDLTIVFRNYATLYFVVLVDEGESPLGILDLIQVFVESLDRCFENVCELDLIFHFDEVHAILSELIQGGLVLETSLDSICAGASASARARKKSAVEGTVAAALPSLADWVAPGGAAAGAWGEGWRRELGRFTR